MSGAGGAAAAAAIAAIAEAIKVSGVMVRVRASQFGRLVQQEKNPLIVRRLGWRNQYAWASDGFVFWCKTKQVLDVPHARFVDAKRFSMPML